MPDEMSDADAADYIGRFRERNAGAAAHYVVIPGGAKITELPPMRRPYEIGPPPTPEQKIPVEWLLEREPRPRRVVPPDDGGPGLGDLVPYRWTWGGYVAGGVASVVYLAPALGAGAIVLPPVLALAGWLAMFVYLAGVRAWIDLATPD
jgi:hypothetical protein